MAADSSYPNVVQHRQDGSVAVPSGVSLDIESGGSFKIAGTAVTSSAAELNIVDGVTAAAADINKLASIGATPVVAKRGNFAETTGAGTYTWSMTLPGNAVLLDIIVHATSLWTATTSAALEIGDAGDPDGFFTAVNLKATDLLAGESLSFAQSGGKEGAYIANSQVSKRRDPSDRTITATVVTVGAAGNGGATSVTVVYSLPVAADITSATKA